MCDTVVFDTPKTCPQCGAALWGNEVFCTSCGCYLDGGRNTDAYTPPNVVGRCVICGQELYEDDGFCIGCGANIATALGGKTDTKLVDERYEKVNQREIGGGGGIGQQGYYQCAVCGTMMGPDMMYCTACGTPRGRTAVQTHEGASRTHIVVKTSQEDDDDHPSARFMLVRLTRQEARVGCRKTVRVDGKEVGVDIPAGIDAYTKLDVDGLGYLDESTGVRGPLRLSFHIV